MNSVVYIYLYCFVLQCVELPSYFYMNSSYFHRSKFGFVGCSILKDDTNNNKKYRDEYSTNGSSLYISIKFISQDLSPTGRNKKEIIIR